MKTNYIFEDHRTFGERQSLEPEPSLLKSREVLAILITRGR